MNIPPNNRFPKESSPPSIFSFSNIPRISSETELLEFKLNKLTQEFFSDKVELASTFINPVTIILKHHNEKIPKIENDLSLITQQLAQLSEQIVLQNNHINLQNQHIKIQDDRLSQQNELQTKQEAEIARQNTFIGLQGGEIERFKSLLYNLSSDSPPTKVSLEKIVENTFDSRVTKLENLCSQLVKERQSNHNQITEITDKICERVLILETACDQLVGNQRSIEQDLRKLVSEVKIITGVIPRASIACDLLEPSTYTYRGAMVNYHTTVNNHLNVHKDRSSAPKEISTPPIPTFPFNY